MQEADQISASGPLTDYTIMARSPLTALFQPQQYAETGYPGISTSWRHLRLGGQFTNCEVIRPTPSSTRKTCSMYRCKAWSTPRG